MISRLPFFSPFGSPLTCCFTSGTGCRALASAATSAPRVVHAQADWKVGRWTNGKIRNDLMIWSFQWFHPTPNGSIFHLGQPFRSESDLQAAMSSLHVLPITGCRQRWKKVAVEFGRIEGNEASWSACVSWEPHMKLPGRSLVWLEWPMFRSCHRPPGAQVLRRIFLLFKTLTRNLTRLAHVQSLLWFIEYHSLGGF
jgi:hypothetical protein